MKTIAQQVKLSFDVLVDWMEAHSESHLNKKLYPGKWTAAHHLFHIVKSSKAISNGFNLPKDTIKSMFGSLERDQYDMDSLKTSYESMLSKGVTAHPDFSAAPDRQFTKDELRKRLRDEEANFQLSLLKWEVDELTSYAMPHPEMGNLSLMEFCYFNILHNRHHLNTLHEKYSVTASHTS